MLINNIFTQVAWLIWEPDMMLSLVSVLSAAVLYHYEQWPKLKGVALWLLFVTSLIQVKHNALLSCNVLSYWYSSIKSKLVVRYRSNSPRFSQNEIEAVDPRGRTPLHLAVSLGHLESVRVLLRHGAEVTKENSHNWTGELQNCLHERQRMLWSHKCFLHLSCRSAFWGCVGCLIT